MSSKAQCSDCGKPVMRSAKSRPEIVCHDCRRRRPRTQPTHPHSCVRCGAPARRKFCSSACSQLTQRETRGSGARKGRTCAQCGCTYDANTGGQQCCSVACRMAYDAERREPEAQSSRVYFPTCPGCGEVWAAMHHSARWCSDRCWLNAHSDLVMSFYALACQLGKGGAMWRTHLIGYLVERDGPKCGICHRKVNPSLPSGTRGDDRGPSIDHVIPRSRGGSDDLANLRLAHWGCNRKRKANGGFEQLALVG